MALVTPLSLASMLLDRRLCVLTFQFSLPLSCDDPYLDGMATLSLKPCDTSDNFYFFFAVSMYRVKSRHMIAALYDNSSRYAE